MQLKIQLQINMMENKIRLPINPAPLSRFINEFGAI